ncbi:hypothetical protein GA0070616_4407 [Micromonospora nigra]|uniref:Uncharacterized protein n=1 Tax=Micromonospora nigra TaxID=145857 RepID=A0A1C6SRM7_9ACTN|nr:hypothetical protein [Micromonospora nigra]SCL32206.1 hypothetical protein GA0070616_4407 [Micromonospora nigra]
MRFPLTPDERTYLDELWRRIRNATHQANLASAKWNRINDELNDLAERSDWDDLATDRVKGVNQRLAGAYAGWNFWQQEVRRLAGAIQAERALRELLGVVDADPMGLGYSRTDDEDDDLVPPPLPDGVDGLSITGRPPRRPQSSPTGPAHPGTPHQFSDRSGSKPGAAGAGVPAAPTRGGAAA